MTIGKTDIFEKSYDETLLFLKHQDDKINRVLTALAFLTTAGVTLYIFSRKPHPPDFPRFVDASMHADDFFFGVFIVGVALSVALSLLALDPTSFRARFIGSRELQEGSDSLLFYAAIGRRSPPEWRAVLKKDEATLRKDYLESLHEDAYRLARRATHKVTRFATANAVVQTTVASLALLGVMRLNQVPVEDRWSIATGVLIVYAAHPAADFLYFWCLQFPDVRYWTWSAQPAEVAKGKTENRRRLGIAALFFLPTLGVTVAGLVTEPRKWEPVAFALFGTLMIRILARLDWKRITPWLPVVLSLAATLAGAGWFWCR